MSKFSIQNLKNLQGTGRFKTIITPSNCLGQSFFGGVYLFEDEMTDAFKVAKVLPNRVVKDPALNEELFNQVFKDIRTLESVDCLLKIQDVNFQQEFTLIEMPYPSGVKEGSVTSRSLRDFIRNRFRFFTEKEIIFTLTQVIKTLIKIHESDCIHGNIKPGSIFFDEGMPLLGDYALHHLMIPVLKAFLAGHVVRSEAFIFSPVKDFMKVFWRHLPYLAPEVMEGCDKTVQSDIFATGILAQTLLTRSEETNVLDVLAICQGINPEWNEWIFYATHPNPGKRYQSAQEMLNALPEAISEEDSYYTIHDDKLRKEAESQVGKKTSDGTKPKIVKGGKKIISLKNKKAPPKG